MRILYGVQGTGNGHLSRARVMAAEFARRGIEVDWLFSGRAADAYRDMEAFGVFRLYRGLTFATRRGRISYLRTVLGNPYLRFLRDVFTLDLSGYDLVVSDFEPVTAWAGRLRGKTVVSLGHQPAFDYRIPLGSRDPAATLLLRWFAPGHVRIGMHWDAFGAPLLPPLVDLEAHGPGTVQAGKVLVYLPFEDPREVQALLKRLPDYRFYVYAPGNRDAQHANLTLRAISRDGFRRDLADSAAVICNAGFELSSECLVLGKRLLVKPLGGQMEQRANAEALRQLGYGSVLETLDGDAVARWLAAGDSARCLSLPPVAPALVDWLLAGEYSSAARWALSDQLWRQVRVDGRPLRRVSPLGDAAALRVINQPN